MTPWTQLEGTEIWSRAEAIYNGDPRRIYHVMDHVRRLYHHAAVTFALPYDRQLDLAILAHDVIYDTGPDKELRSADWLLANAAEATEEAHAHIMRTADHLPGGDNRLVLLDLADFMRHETSVSNYELVISENMALHQVGREAVQAANQAYMRGLRDRIQQADLAALPSREKEAFWDILVGLDTVIKLSDRASSPEVN